MPDDPFGLADIDHSDGAIIFTATDGRKVIIVTDLVRDGKVRAFIALLRSFLRKT